MVAQMIDGNVFTGTCWVVAHLGAQFSNHLAALLKLLVVWIHCLQDLGSKIVLTDNIATNICNFEQRSPQSVVNTVPA
jgi:hypothetical protein